MRLGEALSPDDKRRYVRDSLVPGRILHLHCSFTTPPKDKFVVIAALEPEPILFVINSEINKWLQDRPDLRDRQTTLHQSDHRFLGRDSFLNCTEAIRKVPLSEIEGQLVQNLDNIKDRLTEEERQAVLYAVDGCRTLTKKEIQWIKENIEIAPRGR
jgi:hypothetical protein